jgi:hypothetical protein
MRFDDLPATTKYPRYPKRTTDEIPDAATCCTQIIRQVLMNIAADADSSVRYSVHRLAHDIRGSANGTQLQIS